jgi:hypothetical protein
MGNGCTVEIHCANENRRKTHIIEHMLCAGLQACKRDCEQFHFSFLQVIYQFECSLFKFNASSIELCSSSAKHTREEVMRGLGWTSRKIKSNPAVAVSTGFTKLRCQITTCTNLRKIIQIECEVSFLIDRTHGMQAN